MSLIGGLLFLNLLLVTLNVLSVIEVVYEVTTPNVCRKPNTTQVRFENRRNRSQQRRIVGGTRTDIRAFPYVAAVLVRDEIEDDFDIICACVIVSVYYTLTAAHCIEILESYEGRKCKVRSGSTFWHFGGILHDIISIVKHENFRQKFLENDIGLISVDPGFRVAEIIAVAGLNYIFRDGSYVNVTGWGETEPERASLIATAELYSVTVYILNKGDCIRMIDADYAERDIPMPPYMMDDSQFCAGTTEGGKDACVYDSGGPAVQRNVLVGIISYGGPVCASKNFPGIYTNLKNLNKWLTTLAEKLQARITFVN